MRSLCSLCRVSLQVPVCQIITEGKAISVRMLDTSKQLQVPCATRAFTLTRRCFASATMHDLYMWPCPGPYSSCSITLNIAGAWHALNGCAQHRIVQLDALQLMCVAMPHSLRSAAPRKAVLADSTHVLTHHFLPMLAGPAAFRQGLLLGLQWRLCCRAQLSPWW